LEPERGPGEGTPENRGRCANQREIPIPADRKKSSGMPDPLKRLKIQGKGKALLLPAAVAGRRKKEVEQPRRKERKNPVTTVAGS